MLPNNCYDACAVLMRRVFEISLILAYEHHGIQDDIKDEKGDYVMLEKKSWQMPLKIKL